MDGQRHNAPEHFATPDGAPDIPDEDHATAILGTPMEAEGPSFSLSTYESLPQVGRIRSQQQQQQQQQQQHFPYLESGSSTVNVNPSFGFNAGSGPGSSTYQTTSDWQQAGQHLMFANAASVPIPSHASLSSFGYETYGEGHPGEHVEGPSISHGHGYVAPMDTTIQMGYGYNWDTQDTANMEYEPTSLQSPAGYNSTPVSPLETGTGTGTPTSYASSSSGGQYTTIYTGASSFHAQAAASMGDEAVFAGGEDAREGTPVPKRSRTRPSLSRSSRTSFQLGPSSSTTPSSSIPGALFDSSMSGAGPSSAQAHRSSSHTTPRQAEKKEEKKTRSSHNLVEKQYRNRLNAQFEGLMNALPESLRLQGASLGVVGEGGEAIASDTPERKPSKAEVLEMARMHIRSLEQERDSLVNERDGLLGDINRLQEILESQSVEGGAAGGS
ncbi:helix-loop-helix dna-binding domain containing protein [Ophiostoma piceae UAMH 11346]|uniref:Helix-loop-helix dna-binding domain containing protein n=1 Tax=Ophiostoma piceae (strain UAMH 11346) TaxID=1262450 RepID=S3D204_OPHP1|nr:helix-loop-helix dna-binding domain containing protein [Ophiostoma piceae UAMH 11346]